MRIPLSQLSHTQIAALPRTTGWRARKRGWVRGRSTPVRKRETRRFLNWQETIYRDARLAARWAWNTMSFPRWLTVDDLEQEALLALLCRSGLPGFAHRT